MVQLQPPGQPGVDERLPSRVHLIGIGGTGMAGLAMLLLELGCEVTGSDLEESATVRDLRRRGVSVGVPHDARHLADPELVVYSSAVPGNNVERRHANTKGIPEIKRAAMLGRLSRRKDTIAVAGTHGKTTTTAMLAWILKQAGLQPGWAVGGEVPDLGGSAKWGAGPWFVVEADEFDRSFLTLHPRVAVINKRRNRSSRLLPSSCRHLPSLCRICQPACGRRSAGYWRGCRGAANCGAGALHGASGRLRQRMRLAGYSLGTQDRMGRSAESTLLTER